VGCGVEHIGHSSFPFIIEWIVCKRLMIDGQSCNLIIRKHFLQSFKRRLRGNSFADHPAGGGILQKN
jgi:hypothetical protein